MDVSAYLDRIGFAEKAPIQPDLDTLTALVHAHLYTVPFENFDIHLGIPIALDFDAVFDKIVGRRRGGFCYELNGLFGYLLTELGFEVTYLSGVVMRGVGWDPEFGHIALRVTIEDEPYLVDVGYGEAIRAPMRMVDGQVQRTIGNEHRLSYDDGWFLLGIHDGEGLCGGYRFRDIPRRMSDFAAMCKYHQTSPLSPFTQRRLCTLPLPNGRITLAEQTLIRTADDAREKTPIRSEAEYRRVLLEHFGVELPRVPPNRGERVVNRLHRGAAVWSRRARKAWRRATGQHST